MVVARSSDLRRLGAEGARACGLRRVLAGRPKRQKLELSDPESPLSVDGDCPSALETVDSGHVRATGS